MSAALTLETEGMGELRHPVLLVGLRGWFDVAGAATTALSYLDGRGSAITVGEIDPDPFYDFTQERPTVTIDDGEVISIVWPTNRVDVVITGEGRDLVVLDGTEPHVLWRDYIDCVIEVARRFACEAVVTVGAAADAVPHTRTPPVVGSTSDPELARRLGLSAPTYQGVTGVIGVLHTELARHGIPSISLRVGIPHYLIGAEHPAATAALLDHLGHVLGISVGSHRLRDSIAGAAEAHVEIVSADAQLRLYAQLLESEFDRRAEASIPTADDLAAELERFLREQRPDDDA
jgi:hypothetical protein